MNKISFQNGFLCGMATKGLVRSGELYQPLIWNDEGIYDYFYIDFRRALAPFSLGMLNESIIVYDSVSLPITGVDKISDSIYKITCNITNKRQGITIINKKTSRLRFLNGERVPAFSVHMYIAGQAKYDSTTYLYEPFSPLWPSITLGNDNTDIILNSYLTEQISENTNVCDFLDSSETVTITLI